MNPAFSDLIQKLEAERNDISYKVPVAVEPVILTRPEYRKRKDQEHREKLFFNAGRYAAGARDKTAVKANAWLEAQNDA